MGKTAKPSDVRFAAPARHVVMCCDTRKEGCASAKRMKRAWKHLQERLSDEKLDGKGGVMASRARCLGICSAGPIVAVHPEGVFYGACDPKGIDRIVDEHFKQGEVVESLVLGTRRDEVKP
jgi:(2Fe-2S) ferredoxin